MDKSTKSTNKTIITDGIEITGKTLLSAIPIGGTLITTVYDSIKNNVLRARQEK